MLSHYPHVEESLIQPEIEIEIDWLKQVMQAIRNIRSEMSISPAKRIPLTLRNATPIISQRIKKYNRTLTLLGKLTDITAIDASEKAPLSASALVGELELLIPMAGLIDKEAELARLEKELGKLEKDIALAEGKLNNPTFTDKAPIEIISKEREKLAQAQLSKEKLCHHRKTLEGL